MEKFVIARLFIRPAFVQAFHRQIEELTTLTLQEPGCLAYNWYRDPSAEGTFIIIEHYRDQDGLKYHFSQPYLQAFVGKVNEWKAKELQVHFLSPEPNALES